MQYNLHCMYNNYTALSNAHARAHVTVGGKIEAVEMATDAPSSSVPEDVCAIIVRSIKEKRQVCCAKQSWGHTKCSPSICISFLTVFMQLKSCVPWKVAMWVWNEFRARFKQSRQCVSSRGMSVAAHGSPLSSSQGEEWLYRSVVDNVASCPEEDVAGLLLWVRSLQACVQVLTKAEDLLVGTALR